MKKFFALFSMVAFSIVVAQSCGFSSGSSAQSKYDQLCNIYQNVVSKELTDDEKIVALYDQIKAKLPSFFEKNYKHVMTTDKVESYSFIQKIAKSEGIENWTCSAAKKYYSE